MNIQYTKQIENDELDRSDVVLIGAESANESRAGWWSNFRQARTFSIIPLGNPVLEFRIGSSKYQVRNTSHLRGLLEEWSKIGEVHIDITTLPYEVWGALIRRAIFDKIAVRAVYVEPKEYTSKSRADVIREFELSDEIHGVQDFPGFSRFIEDDEPFSLIVPLGFEGVRFGYLLEKIGAEDASDVVPIIGLPGFRPEFVRYAFEANLSTLERTGYHNSIRYARANCPFSIFNQICEVAGELQEGLIKFGLIGTRPHGLGIILYSLLSKRKTALKFDFPIRRSGRSSGIGRILVYDIDKFRRDVGNVT